MPGAPPTFGTDDRRRAEGEKARRRREVWDAFQASGVARFPFPPHDKIPNFEGATEATQRLVATEEFKRAHVIKVDPDAPQLPFRTEVLRAGKRLIMAIPRLKEPTCFRLFPEGSHVAPTIAAAMSSGQPLTPPDVPEVDMIVSGSVVVGPRGERIGKGGGFSDLEFGLLAQAGRLSKDLVVATTIHDVQRVDALLPMLPHDVPLDLAATPSGVVRFPPSLPRPKGLIPEDLTPATLSEVPWLSKWLSPAARPSPPLRIP